jgi:hypothetical protein
MTDQGYVPGRFLQTAELILFCKCFHIGMAFSLFTEPYKFGLGRLTDEKKICAIILKAFFFEKAFRA